MFFFFSISSSISLLNNSIDALSNSVSLCSFYFFLVAFFKSIHFKLNLSIITKIFMSAALLIGSATNSKRKQRNDNLATMLHCLIIYFSSHFLCHTNRLLTNPIMAITNNTIKITFPVSLPLIKSFRNFLYTEAVRIDVSFRQRTFDLLYFQLPQLKIGTCLKILVINIPTILFVVISRLRPIQTPS